MKCLDPKEYKEFIQKRELRYESERKKVDLEREEQSESAIKKGPLLTSVMKGAPIWNFFKQMNTFLFSWIDDLQFYTYSKPF